MLTGESLGTLPLDLSPNGEVDFGLGILDWGFWSWGGLVRWRWPWELAGAGQEERSNGGVLREVDRSLVGVFRGSGLVEGLQQVGFEGPVGLIGGDRVSWVVS